MVGAVELEFLHIGVHPLVQLLHIALINGHVVHVPAGQLLSQDAEEDGVLVICNGIVDAAVDVGGAGHTHRPQPEGQGVQSLLLRLLKQQVLYLVVVLKPVVSPGGV